MTDPTEQTEQIERDLDRINRRLRILIGVVTVIGVSAILILSLWLWAMLRAL